MFRLPISHILVKSTPDYNAFIAKGVKPLHRLIWHRQVPPFWKQHTDQPENKTQLDDFMMEVKVLTTIPSVF
ncbi:hypothetical protein HCBG_03636 [Histoplasma capsulatum G186AR]|uniref:Uncharacterized protein n=1 Tax=Ajellomyces capsulatus (strain G186AR / H82 / ATCC MYA-2454 / RMSCC 2432) TaxID=447093 RepID=C0NKF6_AJECG|nr:uncharacterized protein HCBG_03636 [Histoplasma capsulatum G186AR]EEH08347.1 hypothetical protein HCBG_03636 [Histoplasma capsulatum G186AR]